MTEGESFGRRAVTIGLAMAISIWVHILGLALWQYTDPLPAAPTMPPMALEIELPTLPEPEKEPEKPKENLTKQNPPAPKPAPPKPEPAPKPETKPEPEPSTEETVASGALPKIEPDDGGSENQGAPPEEETISLESKAPEYLSYLGQIKVKVKRHWIFPPQARDNRQSGRLTALFTLDNNGELIKIVVEESSGHPILDHAAMEAVRGANPFEPFPDHIKLKRLNIRASFDYRIKYISVD